MEENHKNVIIEFKEGKLFLGNIWAAEEVGEKNKDNIKAVLTVASGTGLVYDSSLVKHQIIAAQDEPSFSLAPRFDEGITFISENIRNGNVLVHCFAGVSRSTTIVMAFLIKKLGYTYEQAESLCQLKRPIIGPNDGFVAQLKEFEKQVRLQEKNKQQK